MGKGGPETARAMEGCWGQGCWDREAHFPHPVGQGPTTSALRGSQCWGSTMGLPAVW